MWSAIGRGKVLACKQPLPPRLSYRGCTHAIRGAGDGTTPPLLRPSRLSDARRYYLPHLTIARRPDVAHNASPVISDHENEIHPRAVDIADIAGGTVYALYLAHRGGRGGSSFGHA